MCASTSAPQPCRPSAPQCMAARGKGSRRRRLIATCIRSGARVHGGCVRRNCRKPHTSARTGLRVKEGASGRSQGRKQHAFSKGSVKCENGVSLPGFKPSSPSAAGASAPRTQDAHSGLLVQPSAATWRAASAAARRQGAAGSPSSSCTSRAAASGYRWRNTGSASAHAALYAAGETRSAAKRPRPPRLGGRKGIWRAAAHSSPSPGPWSPSKLSTTAQTASS